MTSEDNRFLLTVAVGEDGVELSAAMIAQVILTNWPGPKEL